MHVKLLLSFVAAAVLSTGCASTGLLAEVMEQVRRDPRDAPWDPRPGEGNLFDQLPAWDLSSDKICCSALKGRGDNLEQYFKEGCHTAQPRPPRSNRC
jgi:hypothetical protein